MTSYFQISKYQRELSKPQRTITSSLLINLSLINFYKFVKSIQIPEYLVDFSVMNISSNIKPLAESGQIHRNFL